MRTGKIARLPHSIREELNRRLQLGEPGVETIRWLNSQYHVRFMLETEFGGRPISEQNLSEWRHGGFLEWQARRDVFHDFTEAGADDARFAVAGASPEEMLHVLAQHYAAALNEWTATQSPDAVKKMRSVKEMSEYAFALSRHEIRCARLRLDQERLELARTKQKARRDRNADPAPAPAPKSPQSAPSAAAPTLTAESVLSSCTQQPAADQANTPNLAPPIYPFSSAYPFSDDTPPVSPEPEESILVPTS